MTKLPLPALTFGLALAATAAPAAVMFDSIDVDRDGHLTESELRDTFGASGASLLRGDADGDGAVSRDEARDLSAAPEAPEPEERDSLLDLFSDRDDSDRWDRLEPIEGLDEQTELGLAHEEPVDVTEERQEEEARLAAEHDGADAP